MDYGKNRIGNDELLVFLSGRGKTRAVCPVLRTLKSNSPFSAPRDDTARAGCGNRAKSNFLPLAQQIITTAEREWLPKRLPAQVLTLP
jgi:hypothetical protein